MFVHLPQGRRSAGRGSRVGADGLLVVLAVAVSAVSGCGQVSTPHSMPPVSKSWDSLKWSRPVGDTSFSSQTSITGWEGGLVAATMVTRGTSFDTQIRISADGIAWSDAATDEPSFLGATPLDLVAGGGGLLLIGYRPDQGSGEKLTAWTSADGRAWQASDLLGLADDITLGAVVAGPGSFVAMTHGGGPLWRSSDGIRWRRVSPESDPNTWSASVSWVSATATGYAAGGDIRLAGCCDQFPEVAAWFSTDGSSWQRVAVEETPGSQATTWASTAPVGSMGVGYVGRDGVISIGFCCATVESFSIKDGQTVAWLSTKGSTWRLVQDLPTELVSGDWLVVADGGRIVAMNRTTLQIHESFDGITWREVPASGPAPTGLSSGATIIVAPVGLLVLDPSASDSAPARLWFATAAQLSGGSGAAP